ncbi:MAG: protein kinase domain-containing protein [Planctomycetota bacterium]
MSDEIRYEIGEEIARGDFATVYRGRDLRLDRDVAIKQLHQEYLNNPKLTERYWQEAQILARLEHPHVMTIYDVVPEKGWLILELMKGSLKDQLGNRPIHLKDLRLTILFVARALSFFQQHDILHGDVKPSNLLIGRNNVIKLGDFGIARRLQSGEGSAVKGATRYIAPEVVSDKFGPVGPHSDIYSLGFSAYELLCGERFESLFPGLHMFGRDQQLAWIMWHSALDRRLPRIQDVLEGVPERLAAVIEKMTNKDPAKRYRSADQIIADLSSKTTIPAAEQSQQDMAQTQQESRRARRKRYAAMGAVLLSLLLSAFMLLPSDRERSPASPAPTEGRVGKVVPDQDQIYLKSEEVIIVDENDLVLLDGTVCELRDLQVNDKLSVQYFDGAGGQTKRIEVTRVQASGFSGRVTDVDMAERKVTLAGDGNEARVFGFDGRTPVRLNGEAVTAADLKSGDVVDVKYWGQGEETTQAVSIDARRKLVASGTLTNFDVANRQITFSRDGSETTLQVADDCFITINGRDNLSGRRPSLGDLQSGDRIVSLVHDAQARRMELEREISDVVEVRDVEAAEDRLTVVADGDQFQVSTQEAIVEYEDGRVPLKLLREGDVLVIVHDAPDRRNVSAQSIEVKELVRDPRLVALVICQQSYDSIQITPYKYSVRDAELVQDSLDLGARVPEDQLVLLQDLSRDKLVEEIEDFLAARRDREQLMVYYVGQAYVELKTGTTYLAARDFGLDNMENTGLALRELIGMMEGFEAREKLLILDSCHEVSAVESQLQPATGDQIREAMVGNAVSRSVTLVGSCDDERRAALAEDDQHGRFGGVLAEALSGDADFDADQQVSGDELFRYLQEELTAVQQKPVRFQPDRTPPRLKPEAAEAVRNLLAEIGRRGVPAEFDEDYESAKKLCGKEPDAELAYALVKLKAGRTGESLDVFQAVLEAHPDALLAYHAAAYQHLGKKEWGAADDLLAELVERIHAVPNPRQDYISHLLRFAGIAQSFLARVDPSGKYGQAIEEAAEKLDGDRKSQYEVGQREFDTRHEQLPSARRGSIRGVYQFDFEVVKEYLLNQLNWFTDSYSAG